MTELKLTNKYSAIVDEELFKYLNKWHWTFDGRYACRIEQKSCIRKKIYLHKFINETPEGFDTDHINGDKLDNRRENLRSAKRGQNNVNQPKYRNKTSKYKGVCWHKQRGKWKAEFKCNGVKKHLGLFISEEDAARAYDEAIKTSFGDFAKLNLKE